MGYPVSKAGVQYDFYKTKIRRKKKEKKVVARG
jgi:hypothetical protein